MAKISINSEKIKSQVRQLQEATTQLQKEGDNLNTANQNCKALWNSPAGNKFFKKAENNRIEFLQTVFKFEQLSNNIMEITKRIEQEDLERAKEIRGL